MMAVDVDRLSRPERLLWGHGVRKPEHIDLEAIAGASGAHVIYRKLDGCAARLVAAGDHAVISVAMDDNLGRRRFSVTIPRQSRGHSGCEPLKAAVRGR